MKLHSFESEVDKLTTRLHRALAEKDRLESKLESSQRELGTSKAEYDKASADIGRSSWETTNQKVQRLEIENDRLRGELERSQVGVRRSSFDIFQLVIFGSVNRRRSAAAQCHHRKSWIVCRNVQIRRLLNFVEPKRNYA